MPVSALPQFNCLSTPRTKRTGRRPEIYFGAPGFPAPRCPYGAGSDDPKLLNRKGLANDKERPHPRPRSGKGRPNDRAAIVDALYRFGAGQDPRDRALFASAFSERARLDLSGPAQRLGLVVLPVLQGWPMITDAVMASAARLDTTQTVTNPQILAHDGQRARLFAMVEVPARHSARMGEPLG